jgi:murein DD-endopeptidase MepM/ murein hydrolase activator NlpD
MKKYYIGILSMALLSSLVFALTVRLLLPQEPVYIEKIPEAGTIPISTYLYKYKYGTSLDSLITTHEKIKKNETLSQILSRHNIPSEQTNEALTKAKKIFNPKRIQAGKNYTVYHTKDSLSVTKCIVYEASAIETIIFKFEDSLTVTKEEKKIDVIRKSFAGSVSSSLYESLSGRNVPAQVAYELSKIFATKVDFFKIHKGDNYKIIYDELLIEGNPIGIGKIHSAFFEHDNQKFYAINFEENGKDKFYDEKAASLKQGFLKAPLKYFRISSKYTQKRFHPVQKIFKAHLGTDYAAPTGTPILAVGNGTVVEAKYSGFNGNYVKIKHNDTYSTQYLHMSKIAKGMKSGKKVTQGQVIGYVGSTGLATGPHVCFRFWKDGKQVDPSKVKAVFYEPIPKSKIKEFNRVKDQMVKELNGIKTESLAVK